MDKNKDNLDELLKEVASLYAEREGEKLLSEDAALRDEADGADFSKIWAAARARAFSKNVRRFAFVAAPVAACLIVALVFIRLPGTLPATPTSTAATTASAPEQPVEIQFLSAKLPQGCVLTKTDYDWGKTLYYITNATGNNIVLVAERSASQLGASDTDGYTHTVINHTDAYVLARKDYNVLLAQADGVQYTLSSEFDAEDLVQIAKSIL